MPLTLEQRKANLEKGRQTRAANKAARLAAPPTVSRETVSDVLEEDDVLGQLMATLGAARAKKVKQSDALKQLATLLDQINPRDHPELADDPTVAAFIEQINGARLAQAEKAGLPPGTQIGTGLAQDAVHWTYGNLFKYCRRPLPGHEKDWRVMNPGHAGETPGIHNSTIIEEFSEPDLITFIPNAYTKVTWNDLDCYFHADEPLTTYKVFYDTWMESKRLSRVGDAHKAYMFGDSDTLPAELQTGDQAVATMRARAFMSLGPKRGGGSIIMGYGGDEKFGIREQPAGEQGASGEIPT